MASTPSGSRIVSITTLTMINAIDHGMDLQEAVDMPRIYQQRLSDLINAEPYALSPNTRKILRELGAALLANHLGAVVVGAPTSTSRPTSGYRLFGTNDPRCAIPAWRWANAHPAGLCPTIRPRHTFR